MRNLKNEVKKVYQTPDFEVLGEIIELTGSRGFSLIADGYGYYN